MYYNKNIRSVFSLTVLVFAPLAASAFRAPENPVAIKPPVVLIGKTTPVVAPTIDLLDGDDAVTSSSISKDKLNEVGQTLASRKFVNSRRHATERKSWGVDNAVEEEADEHGEYWFDSRIHTLGNTLLGGAVHAMLAPISTKVIDVVAYDGRDVRLMVAQKLAESARCSKARVLDLMSGVGISTRALREAFPESEMVVGVDTSPEMIEMAKFLNTHLGFFKPIAHMVAHLRKVRFSRNDKVVKKLSGPMFVKENAERTQFPDKSFDFVSIMYGFHEVPKEGRDRILREAYRVLQPGGTLAILDISKDYTPSDSMLAGEPYVLEYQKNIHTQLRAIKGFSKFRYESIVDNHVGLFLLQRSSIELK